MVTINFVNCHCDEEEDICDDSLLLRAFNHEKTRPIYYGRNSRDQFVVHLIILVILPLLMGVNLNELDVSVKPNELLMSTGCIVGFVPKTKELSSSMTCTINSTQKHTLLCYTVFCSTQ